MKTTDHLLIVFYLCVMSWVFNAKWGLVVESAELVRAEQGYRMTVNYKKNPIQGLLVHNCLSILVSTEQAVNWAKIISDNKQMPYYV